MTARIFQRSAEHLLNARLNFGGSDTLSVIIMTTTVSEATLAGSSAQSLAQSDYMDDWSAYIPTFGTNKVDIGATVVRTSAVFAVEADVAEVTLPYPGVATGYGVLIFKDTGTASTSPVLVIDMFVAPVGLDSGTPFIYQLPDAGVFDLTSGLA
jgi:hypothetical protein